MKINHSTSLDELKWFIDVLKRYKITYWLDSGTLLGLIRENELLDWDTDIDVGIWDRDSQNLKIALEEIAKETSFTVLSYTYNRLLVAYALIPPRSSKLLTLNVGIFREYDGYAYRQSPIPLQETSASFRFIFRVGRFIFYNVLQKMKVESSQDQVQNIDGSSWPFRMLNDVRNTWWIPSSYFKKLTSIQIRDLQASIPADWDNYLAFRYGEWRKPIKEWHYWISDRGLQHKFPHELMK